MNITLAPMHILGPTIIARTMYLTHPWHMVKCTLVTNSRITKIGVVGVITGLQDKITSLTWTSRNRAYGQPHCLLR